MQLSLQNFSTLVEGMAASVQGAATSLLDMTVGSVLRAILEANASVALWIQWLIVQVLSATRLATSKGADCDSFGADFGFSRLSAIPSTGYVTFSRFVDSQKATIPIGTVVATTGNKSKFYVVMDFSNPNFNPISLEYTVSAGVASITLPVTAMVAGVLGNIQPGTISLIQSPISGVDTVENKLAFTGGMDAESDAAFKIRFGSYLAGLSKATNIAISDAISSIQQGISYSIVENISPDGEPQVGNFVVTVDNGTGIPNQTLIDKITAVVDATRPIGTSFFVQPPTLVMVDISMNLTTDVFANHALSTLAVESAVTNYVASLKVGGTLSYTKLAQISYESSGSIINITNLLLNGSMLDVAPDQFELVKIASIVVN